jgi:hypothetical protein
MSGAAGLEAVLDRLSLWETEVQTGCRAAADAIAEIVQEYARTHHPWRNRTGATEASTVASTVLREEMIEIVLSAGTDYARLLELARGGRWAWLWEAIAANESAIRETLIRHIGEAIR